MQTHPNAERVATEALRAPYRGCTVYNPVVLVTVVHARRRRDVERSFLPRYIFVQGDVPVVRSAPGVSHVVRCGMNMVQVPQWAIDRIRTRETMAPRPDGKGDAAYVDLEPQFCMAGYKNEYVPGETVRVTEGPFASFEGVFDRWLGAEQRAVVLVNIFGRQSPCSLEIYQFERA